jgi:hypothetical protein
MGMIPCECANPLGIRKAGSLSCPPLPVKPLGIIVHSYLAVIVHSYFSVTTGRKMLANPFFDEKHVLELLELANETK